MTEMAEWFLCFLNVVLVTINLFLWFSISAVIKLFFVVLYFSSDQAFFVVLCFSMMCLSWKRCP